MSSERSNPAPQQTFSGLVFLTFIEMSNERSNHRATLRSEELRRHSMRFLSADDKSASQAAAKMWGKRLILPLAAPVS